jgi:hypothetical protein
MPATAPVIKRAKIIERGVLCRAQEHEWSYERWSTRKGLLIWASIFSTVATGTAITTALTGKAEIAWIATAFAAFAGAVTAYEARVNPAKLAADHQSAQNEFELLLSDFRSFIQLEAPRASPEDAETRFEELMSQRAGIIKSAVAVERAARNALGHKSNSLVAASRRR